MYVQKVLQLHLQGARWEVEYLKQVNDHFLCVLFVKSEKEEVLYGENEQGERKICDTEDERENQWTASNTGQVIFQGGTIKHEQGKNSIHILCNLRKYQLQNF